MKIKIIGHGPITPEQLDEILFGTSTINRKNPLEEAMDKTIKEVKRGEERKYRAPICFDIQSILANHAKNAFTVVWGDGSHTVIHLQPGDVWDDEKALAMCFTKKALGNKGNFNDKFNDALATKMKIIPGGAGITPEKECACDEEHTCTTCTCKKISDAIQEAGASAQEATNSIAELVHELSKQNNTNKKVEPTKKRYQVLLRTGLYDDQLLFESDDLAAVKRFVHTNAKQRGHGYYTRLWHAIGGMYIDYGSYSTYYFIPDMTVEEWTGK